MPCLFSLALEFSGQTLIVQGGNPVTWLNEDGEAMTGDALYKSNDGTTYFVYPPEAWTEVAKPEVMFYVPH